MDLKHIFFFLIAAALVGVVASFAGGVGFFMKGKDGRASNRMMRWRVAMQGVAVVLLLAAYFVLRK